MQKLFPFQAKGAPNHLVKSVSTSAKGPFSTKAGQEEVLEVDCKRYKKRKE